MDSSSLITLTDVDSSLGTIRYYKQGLYLSLLMKLLEEKLTVPVVKVTDNQDLDKKQFYFLGNLHWPERLCLIIGLPQPSIFWQSDGVCDSTVV